MKKNVILLIVLISAVNLFSIDITKLIENVKSDSVSAEKAFRQIKEFKDYPKINKGEFQLFENKISDTLNVAMFIIFEIFIIISFLF